MKIFDKPGDGFSGIGDIDPGAGGTFLLGTVSDDQFARGYIEVWAGNVAFDSTTGIVSFDAMLKNLTERPISPPVHFVITIVVPGGIAVVDFDGRTGDDFPFYDFSEKLGPDNVLMPGEMSDQKTLKFHTGWPQSFSIGFRIDLGPPHGTGDIHGVVFMDANKNGVRDRCDRCNEYGIPDITVSLQRKLGSNDPVILFTRTDENGQYSFLGLDEGVYEVRVHASPDLWEVTSANPLLVTLVKGPDGIVQDFWSAYFGLFPIGHPGKLVLFGPIPIGPNSPHGTLLDSMFVDPPSMLPVIHKYYLSVSPLDIFGGPFPVVIDTASAWINDELVFGYKRPLPPDSAFFEPQLIRLHDGLVHGGENSIRLFTDGNEFAVLEFKVTRDF